ncbi:carotenoid oxygenase family protein [Haliangium ochraceum]|uniref:Carotenoid oxygenase n=1 Tax=Haliangium ochraceum (strain DSM 14365 / JCM 11303 / SMP-2) TaxID=502025 RepID=D0LZG3_HALO1|nr:carotenoid oxygenase family protein [Haliangium ochraceum]ACY17942.1 Carotenoid oxygenase [Haliangium ochraceum DSM 14365]
MKELYSTSHAAAANAHAAADTSPSAAPAHTADGEGVQAPPWANAFRELTREHDFQPLRVEGVLPPDLEGSFYQNGPVLFSSHGYRYTHWFDGDGGVSAVRLQAGRAHGAARVTATAGLIAEARAGKRLYGGYSSPQPGAVKRLLGILKNTANTSMLVWNRRLFALMEAGLPTEIAPEDLRTLGERDLGAITHVFSAHPHWCARRNTYYGFGVRPGRQQQLDIFELTHTGVARPLCSVPLSEHTLIHDFAITGRYLVFFAPPFELRAWRMLAGEGGYADNLQWKPEYGTEIIVVPIDLPHAVQRFRVDPFFHWHVANGFDDGDDIVVDFVRYDDFENNAFLADLPAGNDTRNLGSRLVRARISLANTRMRREERWSRSVEFPQIRQDYFGRPYRYCYLAAYEDGAPDSGLQNVLAKVDMHSGEVREYTCAPGRYLTEAVFVPRATGADAGESPEDDGYLLTMVYDANSHTSHLAVFDAGDIEAGPRARTHFDHHIPPRFHGAWMPVSQYPHMRGR